jgi:hypothetical protein
MSSKLSNRRLMPSSKLSNRRLMPSRPEQTTRLCDDRSRADRKARLSVEPLEGRVVLSNYIVSTTAYSGIDSLSAAISSIEADTPAFGTITFELADNSTIALTGSDLSSVATYGPTAYAITGSANITIDGSGAPGLTIDGGNVIRPFAVESGSSLSLVDLSINRGKAHGGAGGNSKTGGAGGGGAGLGGAVYDDGGAFTAEGVTFTNNNAQGGAGGINSGSAVDGAGGGGFVGPGQNAGISAGAGGVGNGGHGGNTGNSGGFGGGGGGGNNGSGHGGPGGFGGGGGGGGNSAANVNSGAAGFGGGVGGIGSSSGGGGGGGAGLGGGIFSNNGTITLANDTFTADNAAGGSAVGSEGSPSAGLGLGGAVFIANGSLNATDVTFYGNTVAGNNTGLGTGYDVYVLVDGNGSDGVNGSTASVALNDDILGQPGSGPATSDFVAVVLDSTSSVTMTGAYDLISNNSPVANTHSGQGNVAGFSGTHLIIANPVVGLLASNGGDTQTRALQPTSPAIAAGVPVDYPGTSSPITTDQLGNVRNAATPSLGADEYTPPAPSVTGLSTSAGPLAGGTSVVIHGSNFTGASAVEFGSTAATSFTVVNATTIDAVAPAGSVGIIDVTVETTGGTSATSVADNFTYVAAPTVTDTSPYEGPTTGGTVVTVYGTNFTAATAVDFGSTPATSFTVISSTIINAVDPAELAGTVDVTVETAGGASATSSADEYLYIAAPMVTAIAPAGGPLAGGTSVVIHGNNFTGASAVEFGSTAATSFTVVNATTIDAVAPAGSVGIIDVIVETTGGTSATSVADNFTYVADPTITGLGTGTGSTAGGTSVVITGTNFTDASAVEFGSTSATSFTVVNATTIDAVAPAGSGTVDVTVETAGGTSATSAADEFTYETPTLSITPTTLNLGTTTAGTPGAEQSFTISGTDLIGDVMIIAPTGVQVSDDGGITWTSSLIEDQTDGTLVSTVIESRLNSTVAGSGVGHIANETNGLDSQNVAFSGTVDPAGASQLVITGLADAVAGTEQVVTVTAEDQYGNLATGYGGTVHFTSTDGQAVLPADAALDHGSGTFDVTLDTAGNQSVTGTIIGNPSLNSSEANLLITPALASEFVITSDGSSTPEATVIVTAVDPYGNTVTGYDGTIHFTSTDPDATLPANATLADGAGSFVITFATSGTKSVTVTDTETGELTGTESFAITLAVTGKVYLDQNANGVLDSGEPGLAGRVVFLDLNNDGTLDQGDPTATTDTNGDFTLDVLDTSSLGSPVVEATSQDSSDRYVVDQTSTSDGIVDIGVVPYSPIEPVPVVPNPFTANPDPNANDAFVESLYRAVLGRAGAEAEADTWLVRMQSGMTRSEVAEGFINSPEDRQNEVNAYYEEFLHRVPDATAVSWVNDLEAGVSEQVVVEGILNSPEYQSEHQDPTEFVQDLYIDVLGRVGEGQGVTAWVSALDSGFTREQVVADFVQSNEAVDQLVDSYYTAFLHRQPEIGTSGSWFSLMESSDASAGEVAAGILSSLEFDQDAVTPVS